MSSQADKAGLTIKKKAAAAAPPPPPPPPPLASLNVQHIQTPRPYSWLQY